MRLRILHTADIHIGISFGHLPDAVRDRLVTERFEALERMVSLANSRGAHLFVVAGDLFDKLTVSAKDIKRTVAALQRFEGEAVLVLAGNHDYFEGAESRLWKTFRQAAEGSKVLALTEQRIHDLAVEDLRVRVYACPCPSKYSAEAVTGWVADESKEDGVLHIGLAHGNVEGLGLDADQRYFNMREADLRAAGLHAWLLGHIHVPAPDPRSTGRPTYFMPGIHTPDSVRCTHPGHAWWIEMDTDGASHHEQIATGALRFVRIAAELNHATDIATLRRQCDGLNAPHTLLNLQLTGRLKAEDLQELNLLAIELEKRFLHVSRDQEIAEVLTSEAIAARFPNGTLPHALLTALLADEAHPGDAQVALSLIEMLNA
jgi:exonuclease SbcD